MGVGELGDPVRAQRVLAVRLTEIFVLQRSEPDLDDVPNELPGRLTVRPVAASPESCRRLSSPSLGPRRTAAA
jgi:hypothetical protein